MISHLFPSSLAKLSGISILAQSSRIALRSFVLPFLNHFIDGLLGNQHSLNTRRSSTVDSGMENCFPDLNLSHPIVDGTTSVQS